MGNGKIFLKPPEVETAVLVEGVTKVLLAASPWIQKIN